jgi:hypothetical protein
VRKFTTLCFTFITLTAARKAKTLVRIWSLAKKKAVELVRSSGLDPETTITPTLHYLDECMKSKGYSPTLMCSSSAAREGLPLCWESSSKQ